MSQSSQSGERIVSGPEGPSGRGRRLRRSSGSERSSRESFQSRVKGQTGFLGSPPLLHRPRHNVLRQPLGVLQQRCVHLRRAVCQARRRPAHQVGLLARWLPLRGVGVLGGRGAPLGFDAAHALEATSSSSVWEISAAVIHWIPSLRAKLGDQNIPLRPTERLMLQFICVKVKESDPTPLHSRKILPSTAGTTQGRSGMKSCTSSPINQQNPRSGPNLPLLWVVVLDEAPLRARFTDNLSGFKPGEQSRDAGGFLRRRQVAVRPPELRSRQGGGRGGPERSGAGLRRGAAALWMSPGRSAPSRSGALLPPAGRTTSPGLEGRLQ
ncbi:PREDICTED: uncharacterized protein LOC106916295 [Poecilia mexicana]|uniref:uncharacterized protein LOC106916295 n=1 Tax=Poecilia mexicana TaxID=48701 RepID=UPI00072E4EB2|nr:PREDICTED: uncharacterized protein LOC106916295 [Poecilia mexicana]